MDCLVCGSIVRSDPCEKCGNPTTPTPPGRYFDGYIRAFPELDGQFPDPVLTAAARPLSAALFLFPLVEGSPQIHYQTIRDFQRHHRLPAEDVETYLDILKAGLSAFFDGRRKGMVHREAVRKAKQKGRRR